MLALLVAAALLPGVDAKAAPERLRLARSSAEDIAAFAAARVCLPVVRDGASLAAAAEGVSFPWRQVPGALALHGTTPNYVRVDARGGCYFRVQRGDGGKLRAAVLAALAAEGAGPLADRAFDSGPDGQDGAGAFRQETYCLPGSPGKPGLGLVMSTRRSGGAAALQVTVLADTRRCP